MSWMRKLLRSARSPPRVLERRKPELYHEGQCFEEECIPGYDANLYYPVKKGEVFKDRYQVIGKLGYGTTSTVWFCRDLEKHSYNVLKVNIRNPVNAEVPDREVEFYKVLAGCTKVHPGRPHIRSVLDTFDIKGPYGRHWCLIYEPLVLKYGWIQRNAVNHVLPPSMWRETLRYLLQALDFLHVQLDFIHTDIKANNIMLTMPDAVTTLQNYAELAVDNPVVIRDNPPRDIYESQDFPAPTKIGVPVLIDYGEARQGNQIYRYPVQPTLYRAPEILLQMDWDHKVDIWNLALLTWHLLEGTPLFTAEDDNGEVTFEHHIAQLYACLGKPTYDFLEKSPVASTYFNSDGTWRLSSQPPQWKLEDMERTFEGETRHDFLRFMRRMLRWDPQERPSAKDLLADPWLIGDT